MRQKYPKQYEVGLRILIPTIIGGITFIASTSVYHIGIFWSFTSSSQNFFSAAIAGITAFFGTTIAVNVFLGPINRFAEKIQKEFEPSLSTDQSKPQVDLERFEYVSRQVTQVLNKLDAKAYFPAFRGESRALRGLLKNVLEVAGSDTTVLITGESGTGKELVARGVHERSNRADNPFIAINCAAIASGILESELFGHEKGAFTGAISNKKGTFERAHGGTLFLDEVGDMPLETQAKILRVIETGQLEHVGGNKTYNIDVRLVAATNHDLKKNIQKNTFREDLFHRLNVFPVYVPPLRERREDIPILADYFLEKLGKGQTLSGEALALLMTHAYPGNIRELKNIIERASVLTPPQATVLPDNLPPEIRGLHLSSLEMTKDTEPSKSTLDEKLATYEKGLIEAALSQTQGVQNAAASLLGIKPRSLWHRIKKLGIEPAAFKE